MIWYIVIAIIVAFVIYRKSPVGKGKSSEKAVAHKLKADSLWKDSGKTLMNIYIPKESGDTSEIDVLYITSKGLLVLENKNYAGYIFGSEKNRNWTVSLYAGKTWSGKNVVEKHQFYNPIWQNRTHIKYLKEYLGFDVKAFSLITFSNRGALKDITINSPNVYVCNHSKLKSVLREIWNENPDVLDNEQIDAIYNRLLPLTNIDKAEKQQHINNIQERFNNVDVCPVCGGNLVLRRAKKGVNAGNQFYGCSNYPKCKYIKSI